MKPFDWHVEAVLIFLMWATALFIAATLAVLAWHLATPPAWHWPIFKAG